MHKINVCAYVRLLMFPYGFSLCLLYCCLLAHYRFRFSFTDFEATFGREAIQSIQIVWSIQLAFNSCSFFIILACVFRFFITPLIERLIVVLFSTYNLLAKMLIRTS